MATSSVPSIVFTPTGATFPDESAILAGVQADMNAAFGGNLNPSLSTPQGQLATSQTAIIGEKNNQFAYFLQQIDPATASGFMQDAIGRIYFLTRLPATSTVVQVLCTGLAGVVIPAGAQVIDLSGNRYGCQGGGVIGIAGTVTLPFAAIDTGPIICPIGAITTVYQAIPGWDSVTNVAAGATGVNVETRADFEYRRKQSVAINAAGTLPSIYATAFDVPGVIDAYVTENNTDNPITVGGVTLVKHSVYVAAAGGVPLDVATAIWKKKSAGANWNGNTNVTVTDTSLGITPAPAYTVLFETPTPQTILFAVGIASSPSLPADISDLVKAAIINAFNGGDGGSRARIGGTIYAGRYYAPISAVQAGAIEILSVKIGTTTATLDSLTVNIDRLPVVSAANITVTLI